MKRAELFEFEDFSWFPDWLRTCLTNLLVVLQNMLGVTDVLSQHIGTLLEELKLNKIVDLGSGAGGVMPTVLEKINNQNDEKVSLTLTDKFPNGDALKKFNDHNQISYSSQSVDATELKTAPDGLKTMINCFHHMPPQKAKAILASAHNQKQPIFIYELSDNKMPILIWWLLLPISIIIMVIMVLFMTLAVRPLTVKQVIFTYLIPIIPLCYAWDGQASVQRIYALTDYDELLSGLDSDDYIWEKGMAKKSDGKPLGTYLIGKPKN